MYSQKVFFLFFAIFAAPVLSKPFTIDVLDANNFLFPKQSNLVKRTTVEGSSNDVDELSVPKISLSSFIDNIESGLVNTALSVGGIAGDSNAQVRIVTTPHSVSKRSTVEGSADTADTAVAEGSPETVLVQTTENILASKDIPAHVVIDRVSVYKAPVAGVVLFPTFHLQETTVSSEDQFVAETGNGANSSSESSESSEYSSESSESSEIKPTTTLPLTTSIGSSSSSTVTDVASTSSTTPLTVEEKQIIENNLKEKVAEVEAEPVILTARV